MALLLLEVVIVTILGLFLTGVGIMAKGWFFVLVGMLLTFFELGRIVQAAAGANITTAIIVSEGFNGVSYVPLTMDATIILVAVALVVTAQSIILIDMNRGTSG